jgi:hypothetical protein
MKYDCCIDDNYATDSIRIIGREVYRQQRPERMTAHHDGIETEMIEQRDHVQCMLCHRVSGSRLPGATSSAQVGSYDAMIVCKPFIEQPPELVRVSGEAVKENYRRLWSIVVEIMNDESTHCCESIVSGAIIHCDARLSGHATLSVETEPCISRSTRFNVFPAVLRGKSSEMKTSWTR